MNAQHDAAVVFELHRDARLVGIFFSRAKGQMYAMFAHRFLPRPLAVC